MKLKFLDTSAAALATLLMVMTAASARAGTISVVNLSATGKRRSLRNLTMAAILLLLLPMTGIGQAQVTNVIYQDTFARTGPLNGSTPSPVDNYYTNAAGGYYTNSGGNAAWWAADAPEINSVLMTDGSEIALTNMPGTTNHFYLNGFLPFTPQQGHIYTFSIGLLGLTGGAQWLAAGYALNALTNDYYANVTCGVGWFLQRGGDYQAQLFQGPGTGGGSNVALTSNGLFNAYSIVLDTTPAQWIATWYVNGVQQKQATFSPNPAIHYVGLGADTATGYFTNLTLIDSFMPAPPTVSQPTEGVVSNSAAFSVTALGTGPFGYQWYFNTISNYDGATMMTDGNGISGSTAATVTITNASDFYFVVVTNNYGSATSAVATVTDQLTVASAGEPIWNQTTQTNIVVIFSDLLLPVLDSVSATNTNNYSLDNGATVLSAALGAPNEVVLTTSNLNPSTSYTLTVSNVKNSLGFMVSPSSTNLLVGVYPVNLALWVSADTGVTTNSDGTLAQWNDLSGNGNNLFSATAYGFADPVLTNSASGEPVVYFDANATNSSGKAYGMALFANDAPSLEITGDMSVLALMNFTEPAFGGGHGQIIGKTGYNNPNVPAPYDYHVANNGMTLLRGDGNTGATDYGVSSASATISSGVPLVVGFSDAGNAVTHFLDGQAVGTSGFNRSFAIQYCGDQNQPVFVGGRGDNTKYNAEKLTGEMFELMVLGSAITPYDVKQLRSYLMAKHDLVPVNTNPTNIVVSAGVGNQIALTWPVDHIGWQLQSNSVGLAATGAWFTVAGSTTTNQMTTTPDMTQSNVFYRLFYQP
jgi:hypothetical protein